LVLEKIPGNFTYKDEKVVRRRVEGEGEFPPTILG
jgi:hypothetical protein